MANNRIQIKRSVANATVSGLANGELAFTQASNTLHIGLPDGSGVLRIGGAQYPGILTNSHALVANATGAIDKVITANATITSLVANGSAGSNGQVLVTNGTAVYWGTGTSGSNTYVQFNDSGVANGVAGFTFDKVSNTLYISNTVLTTNINAASLTIGSSVTANSSKLAIGTGVGVEANGSIGSNGQVLHSNGTTVYWRDPSSDLITAVVAGDGLTGGGTEGSVTVNAGQGNGISVSVDAIAVNGANGISVDSSGVNVVGGDGLVSNASGVHVVAGNGISVSSDAVAVNPGSTLTVNSSGAHVNSSLAITNLSLSGNLTVSGTLTTVNTTNLSVTDPLIKLANGNAADVNDIGFFGVYSDGSTKYTGLFRSAGTTDYSLFVGGDTEPTTTVGGTYNFATLRAYLSSGGLTTNSSSANLIANSSFSVGIVANTLTLSAALAGTSGGTGKSTITNNALLVGNASNGYNELTLGTSGYVLQSNGSTIVYDVLDGGSF